jgi:hypothetical protein
MHLLSLLSSTEPCWQHMYQMQAYCPLGMQLGIALDCTICVLL